MNGQGCIVGVGALDYPAEFQGASEETLFELGVGKMITLTSTYDHRVIQGAGSGEFLQMVHELLIGERRLLRRTSSPRCASPTSRSTGRATSASTSRSEIDKTARVQELINAYRVRGHLMADTDPLEYRQRTHPDLEIETHGLTLWDLDREFVTGGFGGKRGDEAARHPGRAARLVLPHRRHRVHAHPGPRPARAGSRSTSR